MNTNEMLGNILKGLATLPDKVLGSLYDLIQKLNGPEWIKWNQEFKKFLRKEGCWKRYIIDCDSQPVIPDGLTIEEHRKGGVIEWNPEKISLYLSEIQKTGRIVGTDLRKELAGMPVLNACVLDYLLANPHLIPEEWKGKHIFFWGTVYRGHDDGLFVRYLCWSGDEWYWGLRWLDSGWSSSDPAVCLQVEN